MLFACAAVFAASRDDERLQLDRAFNSAKADFRPQALPPAPTEEHEQPLSLSSSIKAEDAGTPQRLPELVGGTPSALPESSTQSAPLSTLLHGIWLLTAGLLGLHLLREWLRVLRLRVHRPARSVTLEHANWPSVSILIPARGSSARQISRIASLPDIDFDYPIDKIHFVPVFDPAEPELAEAVNTLVLKCPGRVHPLAMMAGPNTTLATALHAGVATSIGTALVVLDQDLPLRKNWLRTSITPLLDPAVGCVLSRAVSTPNDGALSARLELLADQADTVLATRDDALTLLLCGKARIRALRRQAVKSLDSPDLLQAPDGASLVLNLTRLGWQSGLLAEITSYSPEDSQDLIRAPRLHPSIALQSMRLASLLLDPRIPSGARRQGGAAFFSAALPLIWLFSLLSGIALYFAGSPLSAGLAIALCTATSFDPHGNPSPAFRIAAAARMAGVREEIRLLPLTWLGFTHRILDGMRLLVFARRSARLEHGLEPAPVRTLAIIKEGK